MTDLIDRARAWIAADPEPSTQTELQELVDADDREELADRMDTTLEFGTAGIRGRVGAGPGRMNRAVVIRVSYGLARHLLEQDEEPGPVVVGFDARPTSRQFAEDTVGVLAAAGIPVLYFPDLTPTPLVAYAAKHLGAAAAVVVTASHNPPADNGYKVYGPEAAQIVPPTDLAIQREFAAAPEAAAVPRIEAAFTTESPLISTVPDDIFDCYWQEVAAFRSRTTGSDLRIVYTPLHGVGGQILLEVMRRAGHSGVEPVPEQALPDGTFPTVDFPNPEEPGALDLALRMAEERSADLVIANDPDADRLAVVVPDAGEWRPLTGNEVGVLLADYVLSHDAHPDQAIVTSSIVSSPMLASVASSYGARHDVTLTGFKWITRAGLTLEAETGARFVFGFEEALGYTIGGTVRDKDGISAALAFTDLVADASDAGESVIDLLVRLWRTHGLWVSSQTSLARPGPDGPAEMEAAVASLGDTPPEVIEGLEVTGMTDYRRGGEDRPEWLGEQDLIELTLGDRGRVLVRPSGTEPKLKIYVDLRESLATDVRAQYRDLMARADALGRALGAELGL